MDLRSTGEILGRIDPIAAAALLGGMTSLLWQRFDLATRRLSRTVVGFEVDIIEAGFGDALRSGLAGSGDGPLVVFAGFEALLDRPENGSADLPGHLVGRVREGLTIDHASGAVEIHSRDRQALLARLEKLPPAEGAGAQPLHRGDPADWRVEPDFETYARHVAAIREAAAGGAIEGAVLSVELSRPTQADPFALYRRFVAANPSPFGYVLKHEGFALVGSSPLAFLTAHDGRLHLETDAGTRPVSGDAAADAAAERDLLINPKDAAEHSVVVDAEHEALSTVARPGTLQVVIDRQVRKFSHVMHLYSALEAELAEGVDLTDAIRSLAPAAAVSGRPKRAAAELGLALEGRPRGPYGGVVGLVEKGGSVDLAVVIRSLWLHRGRAALRVGGKIVPTSTAEDEYDEALAKARFLIDGVARAEAVAAP